MERIKESFGMIRRAAMALLLAVMTAWPVGGYAQTYTSGDWQVEINPSGEATLYKYIGSDATITTPTTISVDSKDYSVTKIYEECFFHNTTLTSIEISEGVVYIGNRVFNACTNLESVTLPSTLNTIGNDAFASCYKLPSITLPSQVTAIGEGTFYYCLSLASVTFNGNVTSIGANAFKFCTSLTGITLPESVTTIGNSAFYACDTLTSITLPSGVTAIGQQTFYECRNLASVTLEGNVITIGREAFGFCEELTGIMLPNSVNTIEDKAFKHCSSLGSITIPSNVSIIGEQTFDGCTSLANVTINGNITTIEEYAFYGCPITQITLPYSVVIIDKYAFSGSVMSHLYYAGPKSRWENMVYKGEDAIPATTNIHWQCTATFDMQGHGTAPSAQTVYSGVMGALTAPATNPTAQGYDFDGWYKDAACRTRFQFLFPLSDDVTIYALWIPRKDNYVYFNTGGKGTRPSTLLLITGQTVTEPEWQTYTEGGKTYGIEGWYTDQACTDAYDFATAVDHSFTLYAKWAEATGTATVTANAGGTVTLTDAMGRVIDSDKIFPGQYTLTVTPASGYSFTGSFTRTNRSSGASEMAQTFGGTTAYTAPLDLTAHDVAISVTFSEITSHIVYVSTSTDGTAEAGTFTLEDGNNPQNTYTGNGETLAKVNDGSEAYWNTAYNLTLTVTSGEGVGCAITIVNNGMASYIDASTTSYMFTPKGSVDIRLYYFVKDVADVTLSDQGSNSATIATLNNNGQPQPHTVKLDGRTFYKDGQWNTLCLPFTLRSLTGTPLEGATVLKMNITSKNSGIYKTRLEADGTLNLSFTDVSSIEAGTPYLVKFATAGDAIVDPVFNGVFITGAAASTVTSNDTNIRLEGTYDALTSTSGLLTAGRADDNGAFRAALSISEPTRDGYTFNGWNTANDGTGDEVNAIPALSNNSATIYATWIENAVTIDGTGATGITNDLTNLDGKVADVTLTRTFPAGKKQTVCLPFDPSVLLDHGTVWAFTGIENGKAVMTEQTGSLQANTPYIFEADNEVTSITFSDVEINIATDPQTEDATAGFTFHGTYAQKIWEADDAAVTGGTIYGFMMKENDGQAVGQFVKARKRTSLRPFSCWLEYNGDLTGTEASPAPQRAGNRAEAVSLPDVIEIVWMGGSEIPGTTGMMDTRTGEIYEDDAWYSIYGTKLDGRPAKTGLYINNGKKVYISVE